MTYQRKEQIGNCTLYLGDCLDILPTLPKVDAVVTDPPYGIGYTRNTKNNLRELWGSGVIDELADKPERPIYGDDKPFNPEEILNTGAKKIILFGANAYASRLPDNYGWIVWDKKIPEGWAASACEMAWTNFLKSVRIHRQMWSGMMREGKECPFVGGGLVHPTQKPEALMDFCVSLCVGSETVFDPYMGSGTTGVACAKMGRSFIGIEIDEGYFDIAYQRIEDAYRQADMFVEGA